ncbi:LpqN/LpqT family lipoprotein [Mycolicibacterium sp. 141076]|uniref:LpqN/LpqT family lipoprotein n=1 Tax=Mycolicibacterium sp. 141076 TaxID=3090599 RepID=UPI00299E46F9|nr:LpqN/LpqT family lipoprotein [Mycolicibacterium sp. 141076]MDX1878808.1 LpqN/LpqT family lipoprotein [Mycolicibacterium sp. 141076]
MSLETGATFAGYTVRRLLGSGGMGDVYLVQHPRLPRLDAMKVLRETASTNDEFRIRFEREANIAAGLWHPHIVGLHDRGEFESRLWITMDYVDGTDAAQLVKYEYPNGLPLELVVDIVKAMSSALDYAHQRGLLHRDIKPANILLSNIDTDERRILLSDFGIARQIGEVTGLTSANLAIGTVSYSAPEQLMGGEIDGRADQYALAATAYRLLTGQTPYQDTNQIAVISQHLSAPPPKASDLKPWLEPLNEVLIKAMGKSPEDRFDSCTKFARAFERQAELVTESPTLNLRTAELKLPTVTPVVTPEPAAEPPSAPEVTPPPVTPPPVVSAEPVPEPEPAPGPEPEPEPVAQEPVAPPPAPEPPVPPVPPVSPPSVDPVSEPTPPPVPQRGPVGPPPDPKPFRPEPDSSPSAPPYRQPVPGPPPIPPQRPVRPTHETVSPTVVLPVIPADPAAHAAPGVGRPTAPPPPSYSQLAADIGKTPPGRGQSSGGKTKIWVIGGAIAAVIVVLIGVVLLNSGDDSSGPSDASRTSTQSSGANTPSSSHKPAPPVLVGTPGNYQTIATYLKSNNIQESLVHRNEPGAPVVTMPMPPGWADAGPQTPAFAYQSIVYNGPSAGTYRPSATALISRLGPNADAQKILDFAPGELNNLPGFTPTDTGTPGTVDGHKSFQIAGSWNSNGVTKLITQNTVVIQDGTGLYVMQINIDGVADQAEIIKQITEAIDRDTKIAAG